MPLSNDPDKRARQLANLPNMRGELTATAWKPGEAPALKHGLRSRRPLPVGQLSAEVAEIVGALADAAPVRDRNGSLPAADEVAIEQAARALHRARKATEWADNTGRFDEKGDPKPITRYELECDRDLGRALAALGMTPEARYRMLGDVAPAIQAGLDPATLLSAAQAESDPALRARLLERAGLIGGDDDGA